jgi:hypothetical protein
VPTLQLGGPQVDVLALEAPHPLARLGRQRLPVAVLDDDQGWLGEGERHVPLDQCGESVVGAVGACHPLLPLGQQALADGDQHLGENGVLGVEVLVQRRAAHAHGLADVTDGDAVEAALGEQPRGHVQDLLATLDGAIHGLRVAPGVNER